MRSAASKLASWWASKRQAQEAVPAAQRQAACRSHTRPRSSSCLSGGSGLAGAPTPVCSTPFSEPCEAHASPDPAQTVALPCRRASAGAAVRTTAPAPSAVLARSVLVLKKLGDELLADFVRVLHFLGVEEGMRVLVEPHEYLKLVGRAGLGFIDTYTPAEACKCGPPEPAQSLSHHVRLPPVPLHGPAPGSCPPVAPAEPAHG